MSIFPEINPSLLKENDHLIRAKIDSAYDASIGLLSPYWNEADFDNRFYSGDQNAFQDMGYGPYQFNRRKPFYFNRIKPIINSISGMQRMNRKSTMAIPIENADEETAGQFTKILTWLDQKEDVGNLISEAFEGALITGLTLMQVWMDYRNDPINGDIKIDNCAYNSFVIDPFFRKADLSDCNYIWKRNYISPLEANSLFPGKEDFINDIATFNGRDNKFQYMPENLSLSQFNLIIYDEYYYKTTRKQKLLVDTQTGDTFEWKSQLQDELNMLMYKFPQLTIIETEIISYNVALLLNGIPFYDGPQPWGTDKLPFVPVFAYYNPNLLNFSYRIQGVVRGLRDSQFLFNRRKTIELNMLESQINSGWKYKVDALVNPKDVFLSGEGRGLAIKREAQMDDVQQIIPAGIDASVFKVTENLAQEMRDDVGMSQEALGTSTDDVAGILAAARQKASNAGQQGLIDNVDRAQKLLGAIKLDFIQANFTPGKVRRITREEPTFQFNNKLFGRYGIQIEEGLNTTTQRQNQFAQAVYLQQVGVEIPKKFLLQSATLQNKKELIEMIEAQEKQAQELQQLQLQTTLHEQEARTELAKARAVADQGLGLERLSRVKENQALAVQREAEAVRDENQALLNLVKAIKELDTMDLDHIEKIVGMQSIIKQQEMANREQAQGPTKQQNERSKQTSLI